MWMFGIVSSAALEVVVVMPQVGPARLEHRQHPTGEWFHLPCHHSREMTRRPFAMRVEALCTLQRAADGPFLDGGTQISVTSTECRHRESEVQECSGGYREHRVADGLLRRAIFNHL